MSRTSRVFGFGAVLVIALATSACGKKGADAKHGGTGPGGTGPGSPGYNGGAVTTEAGQQYGMTDAPSSGESGANRPKMNSAAASAYAAGIQAFKNGDLAGARDQFNKAVEADSKAYQAAYSLGVVRERLGESSGALSSYNKAIGIVSDYEPAIVAYGVLMARDGRASEAESFLKGKQSKMPKSAAVVAALAEVKSIQGDSTEAQALAREALKKNPDYRPAMITIARDHYRKRRLDLALYTPKAILDGIGPENPPRDKQNPDARLLRALIYKEQNNKKDAIEDFKIAISTRPDLVEARIQLASYLLESGNAFEAASTLEGAIRYDKSNLLAHLYLGDAYRLMGKVSDAKKELEWVLAKNSSLAQVHYNLGLLYLFGDNIPGLTPMQATDKAIAELEQYKTMKPKGKPGERDDTDELITRAKTKKGLLEEQAKSGKKTSTTTTPAKPGTGTTGTTPTKPATGGTGGTPPPATGGTGTKPSGGTGSTGTLPPADAGKKK